MVFASVIAVRTEATASSKFSAIGDADQLRSSETESANDRELMVTVLRDKALVSASSQA
jgi:hypothetical protein